MTNIKEKMLSGFVWEAFTRTISQIASWVSTIWVARILDPTDYGIVGVSGIFTGLALRFAGMGLGSAIINRKELQDSEIVNLFWLGNILSVFIYSLLFFLSPLFAEIFSMPELVNVVRVAGVMLILGSLSMVSRAVMMRNLEFKKAAIINAFANLIVTISAITLATLGFRYWALIYATLLSELFLLFAYVRISPFKLGMPKKNVSILSFLGYGINILSSRLLDYLNTQWPIIISGRFLEKETTGYYQMAFTLAALPLKKIGEIFFKIIFPSFSKIQGDIKHSSSVFLVVNRYLMILTMPMFAGIAAVSEELIFVVLGSKWIGIIEPIKILCFMNIFMISAQIIPRVLEGMGDSRSNVVFQLICLITYPLAMLAGVSEGLDVMLLAWLCVVPVGYIYLIAKVLNKLGLKLSQFLESVAPAFISSGVMYIALGSFGLLFGTDISGQVLSLIVKVFVGIVVFFGCYMIIKRRHLIELFGLIRRRST